ncbi:hypothetical protein APB26_32730 [Pseudomonas aeruginosa]|uniref:hypothetical protein n=1 Tax=Pseudomonas aeruginosa TaxID=287 RepID=UPI00071BAF05|nr:hypothetical protein [Pseudomonas aeruginosa]KSQ21749.1 hypothetical protein APB26_32730 [Pseudomonas aeruginosa]RPV61422.1 hypothetical protein IPC838_19070 [Pseudomonas aeruginosa]
MAISSAAIAQDDAIEVPKMTMIPFVLTSSTDDVDNIVRGTIQPIKVKAQQGGTIQQVTTRPVDQLVARGCGLNFEPNRKISEGPVNAKGGVVNIACSMSNGRILVTTLLGSINDMHFKSGLSSLRYGVQGHFLVDEGFSIPSSSAPSD